MRGSPIKNFICVIALLFAMAVGVVMTTGKVESEKPGRPETEDRPAAVVDVEVRLLFSHRPTRVKIPGFGVDARPEENELEFVLSLATERETELPLDIIWPEQDGAHYFTQITIRRDGVEDDVVVFTDQFAEFSDTFKIDTRNKKRCATAPRTMAAIVRMSTITTTSWWSRGCV
jgi:hypothetical protein